MVLQIKLGLCEALGADVLGLRLAHHLDVASLAPVVEHGLCIALTDALAMTHLLGFVAGKLVGQQVEQVARSVLADSGIRFQFPFLLLREPCPGNKQSRAVFLRCGSWLKLLE